MSKSKMPRKCVGILGNFKSEVKDLFWLSYFSSDNFVASLDF
jgi:hypothetical protein